MRQRERQRGGRGGFSWYKRCLHLFEMPLYKLVMKLRRQYSDIQESFDHYAVTSSEEAAVLTKVLGMLDAEYHLCGMYSVLYRSVTYGSRAALVANNTQRT
jgi:hypothetical protein